MDRTAIASGLVSDLVAANRILAGLGVLDGFGHISARDPAEAQRYLLSRSLAPELVTAADIVSYDLESNALHGDTRPGYLERFIHGEIYARRPDVQAVVHSHAPAVVPFAASSVALRPIYHMSGFLARGTPVFEMRERFGATDLLIRTAPQGAALADSLGEAGIVLMRGHGFCAVGTSIPLAVFRAVYTQINAELQQRAIGLGGDISYLSEGEAALAEATNAGVVARPWGLWKAKFAPS